MPSYADPVRNPAIATPRRIHPNPDICEQVTPRSDGGHGRRPGALVVPVAVHLEVQDASGRFLGANSSENIADVAGTEAEFRILVSNLSLYDVESVEVLFAYRSVSGGPALEGIGAVKGGRYGESEKMFTVERVEADKTAVISFRAFFTGTFTDDVAKAEVTLRNFDVSDAGLLPRRTSETPFERRNLTGSIERFGIGSVDSACFRGEETASAARAALPPVLTPVPRNASVRLEKSANTNEARAGAHIVYTISVQNTGDQDLLNLTLDDRFSGEHLRVLEAGGGVAQASGLLWQRPTLATGDRWIVRYRTEVLPSASPSEPIPNTATLTSEQLRDTPTTQRIASASVSVITTLPKTGVDFSFLTMLLEIGLGILVAYILARIALFVAMRKFE